MQLDSELLANLEAVLLHGDFELAYQKSSAVLEQAGINVFASAPLSLRLFYVLCQSAFFSGRQGHLLSIINARLGGLNKVPTQVFLLWQLLQLDEGEVVTCKQETEAFLDELVALHRQKSLQHVTQVVGGHGMRIFSDGTLDISTGASQKDLLGAAMAIAAAGTRDAAGSTKAGAARGTIGEFLAMQRAASAAVKGAGGVNKKGPDAAAIPGIPFPLPHQDVGATPEQTSVMLAAVHNKISAVHNKISDSLHGSHADLAACGADKDHPGSRSASPALLPHPSTSAEDPLALHQLQSHSHVHAGPVHVYDWLQDGGEHMHVVALCRFYLVDLLCHELHDNDGAEAFLCSEEAFLILEERDRDALRAEVVAAELAFAAQGGPTTARARLSSDFLTMMGEVDDGQDWNRSDQAKAAALGGSNGSKLGSGGAVVSSRAQAGRVAGAGEQEGGAQGAGGSWASGAWDAVRQGMEWARQACGLQPSSSSSHASPSTATATTAAAAVAGSQPAAGSHGPSHSTEVVIAIGTALVIFAVYKERAAIRRAMRKRTTSTWAAAQELIRMAFSLTPSPVASGYRPLHH